MRGNEILSLDVVPFSYDRRSKSLEVFQEIEINIEEVGDKENYISKNQKRSRTFQNMYNKLILDENKKNFKINQIASSLAMKKHLNLATLIPLYDDQNVFWRSPTSGIQKASQEVSANGVEINNFFFEWCCNIESFYYIYIST